MKNIIAFSFLFAAATVSAQDIPAGDTTAKPAITAIGKPDGVKAEMKIGRDGGSFTSSDGKVNLIIPEGAVSKKTTFSIQPVTNLMPNGNGKAYQLEPSGIQFQKPVQLLFHYDPEESEDSMQLLMAIAMQDDKGQWHGLNEFTLDTVAKTISGNINHFSIWATFDQLKLKTMPGGNRLKVKKTQLLGIWGVFADKEEKDSRGLSKLKIMKSPLFGAWFVDGFIKGNAEVGTLEKGIVAESDAKYNEYTAPANVPDKNPVTISVNLALNSYTFKGWTTFKNRTLETKILIYDNAYEVTMISHVNGYAGSVLGKETYKDTGSFVVNLDGKKTKIIEKKNKNIAADLAYAGNCIVTQIKPGSGSIHIAGVKSIEVTPATPALSAIVEIIFIRIPVMYPLLHYNCPPIGKGARYSGTTEKANAIAAQWSRTYPINIKFEAKEGSQIIEVFGVPNSDLFYRVEVRQLNEHD